MAKTADSVFMKSVPPSSSVDDPTPIGATAPSPEAVVSAISQDAGSTNPNDTAPILAHHEPPKRLRKASRAAVSAGLSLPRTLVIADIGVLALAGPRIFEWYLAIVLYVILAWNGGFYRSRLTLLFLDDVFGIVGRLLVASTVAAAFSTSQSTLLVHSWGLRASVAATLLLLTRLAIYALAREVRRRRIVNHRTLIVGAGDVGHYLARSLAAHPEYGLRPIGFYDPDPVARTQSAEDALLIVGESRPLDAVVQAVNATVVILAFSSTPAEQLVSDVRACARLRSEIFYVPRLFDLNSLSSRDVDDVWGLPLVRLRRATLRSSAWRAKRAFDIGISLFALIALLPLILLIGVLVRVSIGPDVIFKQQRVSLDSRAFVILKFRTMPTASSGITDTDWSASERRPNWLGRLLRATSLDELPQLWNILRGDMSLVGPRPEREHFVRQFAEELTYYDDRHRVPAGLTGLAQIHGLRGDTSIDDRARFDNAYVEGWSLSKDVKILLRTPLAAFRWRGR